MRRARGDVDPGADIVEPTRSFARGRGAAAESLSFAELVEP